jgi:hypothetical protein
MLDSMHHSNAAIHDRLAEVAAASPVPPPWYEAWAALGPHSTAAEKLVVYRAVCAAGSVPPEAAFFLVAWIVDVLAYDRAEEGLGEAEGQLEAVRRKCGLGEDAPAEPGIAPAEYCEAMARYHDAWDELYAATLEAQGEAEMARLFRHDSDEFQRRYNAGRQFFHGRDSDDDDAAEDDWLEELREAVSSCVDVDSPMAPLGLRYRVEEGFWEVWVYPTPVELVGGRHDGEIVMPGFHLDLEQLRGQFESLVALSWDAQGLNSPEGPYVSIEGVFRGREVYLQVFAGAPADAQPGLKFDATGRRRRTE